MPLDRTVKQMGKERCDDVGDCLEPCGRQRIRCSTAFVKQRTDRSNHIINADWLEISEGRGARYRPKQRRWSAGRDRSNAGNLVIKVALKSQ